MSAPTNGPAGGIPHPAENLDPRVRTLWRLEVALATAVLVVAGAAGLAVAAMAADPPVRALAAALAGVAMVGAAVAVVAPPIAYRAVRFEVTPLGLLVQTGIVVRSLTIVPHSRIQSVQTTTDPLQRAMGLATVEVRTASSAVARVPGLDAARVDRLRDDLAAMAGTGEAT